MNEDHGLKNNQVKDPDIYQEYFNSEIDVLLAGCQKESCNTQLNLFFDRIGYDSMPAVLKLYTAVRIYLSAQVFAERLGVQKATVISSFGRIDQIQTQTSDRSQAVEYLSHIAEQCAEWRTAVYSGNRFILMEKARNYIQQNYRSESLSLEKTADAVNLSPTYFCALFKQDTGMTFTEYVNAKRIDKAKELLCSTLINITEIAYQVGFNDYRYFGTVFKKMAGDTPRAFRKKNTIGRK